MSVSFGEQPQRIGLAFHYPNQYRPNGDCLKGENSTAIQTIYPTVEVRTYFSYFSYFTLNLYRPTMRIMNGEFTYRCLCLLFNLTKMTIGQSRLTVHYRL